MEYAILALLALSLCFDFSASVVTTINDTNFKEYLPSQRCVILEFYSPSCPHCVSLAPIYEEVYKLAADKRPDVIVAKLDGSVNRVTLSQYSIYGFPTITLFLPGNSTQYHTTFSGARTKEQIFDWINSTCPQPKAKQEETRILDEDNKKISENITANVDITNITSQLLKYTSAFGEDILKLVGEYKSLKKEVSRIETKLDQYSAIVADSGMSVSILIVFIGIGAVIGYSIGRRSPTQVKPKVPL